METVVRNDELINIHASIEEVSNKGATFHSFLTGIEFRNLESTLLVACGDSFNINLLVASEIFSVQKLGKVCLGQFCLCPLLFEQQRHKIILEPESGHKVEFWHENYIVRKNITPVGKRGDILTGIIIVGNDIGMSDLFVLVDSKR